MHLIKVIHLFYYRGSEDESIVENAPCPQNRSELLSSNSPSGLESSSSTSSNIPSVHTSAGRRKTYGAPLYFVFLIFKFRIIIGNNANSIGDNANSNRIFK